MLFIGQYKKNLKMDNMHIIAIRYTQCNFHPRFVLQYIWKNQPYCPRRLSPMEMRLADSSN